LNVIDLVIATLNAQRLIILFTTREAPYSKLTINDQLSLKSKQPIWLKIQCKLCGKVKLNFGELQFSIKIPVGDSIKL